MRRATLIVACACVLAAPWIVPAASGQTTQSTQKPATQTPATQKPATPTPAAGTTTSGQATSGTTTGTATTQAPQTTTGTATGATATGQATGAATTGTTTGQAPAAATPPQPPPPNVFALSSEPILPGIDASKQWRIERLGPNHWKLSGDVEIQRDDVQFYADEMEVFTDTHTMTAQGNVVFSAPTHRISADRVEFNLQTKLGTFYNAAGTASMAQKANRSMFGVQEPDVYFYGETLEKMGERKYRLTNGGFTACVQPRPRWEMTSGSVVLNLDHYALLTNAVLKVKAVPLLYIPVVYYPINKEDRATGLLIPTYGVSSIRGQTISNAYFIAMGRSHDATVTYDWFSKTGQAFGTEYRYVASPVSLGDIRFYNIAERPTTQTNADGSTQQIAGRKSYEVRGNVAQSLPLNLKARGRLDYFSDLTVQQTYQQNIYYSSRRQRMFSGNVNGMWGPYTLNVTGDRNEVFFSETSSTLSGSKPRVALSYAERPVAGSIVYVSANSEYASMIRSSKSGTTVKDLGLNRLDFSPMVRVPFTKWPFLTINSSVAWRYTWWSKSLDEKSNVLDTSVDRQYLDMQARIVGPVFNRIWNTNSGFAEKIKHTVEPFVAFQRVTDFPEYSQIVQLDSADYVVGRVTKVSYGLSNRFYAKQPAAGLPGAPPGPSASIAREFINVMISQSYYTDAKASQVDAAYASSFQGRTPTHFSPVALQLRTAPVVGLDANFRAEYDVQYKGIRTMVLQGTWNFRDWLMASGAWSSSKYFTPRDPQGKLGRARTINVQSRLFFNEGRYGGDVNFNYDFEKQYFIQRRFLAFYNAQCCGFAVDYQVYDFGRIIYLPGYGPPVRKDKRFNISITLAGLGTFSNFLGAFGGSTQSVY
jgi:LPS-assembly protein